MVGMVTKRVARYTSPLHNGVSLKSVHIQIADQPMTRPCPTVCFANRYETVSEREQYRTNTPQQSPNSFRASTLNTSVKGV